MTFETKNFGTVDIAEDKLLTFPEGIIGFPFLKKFALIFDKERPDKGDIMWLQSMEEGAFAMPVISPTILVPTYAPEVNNDLLEPLGEMSDDDIFMLVTITVPKEIEKMSVNLKAPFVINSKSNKGVQVACEGDYSVKFPVYKLLKDNREAK